MHSQAVDGPDSGHTGRAAELRSAFDRAFAEAPRVELVRPLDFLALRLGVVAGGWAAVYRAIAGTNILVGGSPAERTLAGTRERLPAHPEQPINRPR